MPARLPSYIVPKCTHCKALIKKSEGDMPWSDKEDANAERKTKERCFWPDGLARDGKYEYVWVSSVRGWGYHKDCQIIATLNNATDARNIKIDSVLRAEEKKARDAVSAMDPRYQEDYVAIAKANRTNVENRYSVPVPLFDQAGKLLDRGSGAHGYVPSTQQDGEVVAKTTPEYVNAFCMLGVPPTHLNVLPKRPQTPAGSARAPPRPPVYNPQQGGWGSGTQGAGRGRGGSSGSHGPGRGQGGRGAGYY